jgi:predicted nucleic acid-binding protein
VIVDSSALGAFFLNEESRPKIESVMAKENIVHTLDIAPIEVLNAVWKRFMREKLTREQAELISTELERAITQDLFQVNLSRDFLARSLRTSLKYGLAVYDSLFIVLCLRKRDRLLTLDEKQREVARLEGIRTVDIL